MQRLAQITPRRQMRELLGADTVLTPVRRSGRLVGTPPVGGRAVVDSIAELPEGMDIGYMPNASLMD